MRKPGLFRASIFLSLIQSIFEFPIELKLKYLVPYFKRLKVGVFRCKIE